MMRWKLWDDKDGDPPSYAVPRAEASGWMVLQELTIVNDPKRPEIRREWQDVPLHIEGKP
jgi:hypothetical protein